ncbi:UvrD-helicase domain-containing protein [Herbaspirillum sp. NPDC101396]|uniref:UvrD-helicase domain-containing protein n=1 Tax=Herbaspirillum sp. NPDC101396 TaxID=3364005 RepID=UPI00383A7B6C
MNAPLDAGNERDTGVVEAICSYVTASPPRSFFLFAGAGSGKTRTLIEVLRRITGVVSHDAGGSYAEQLRSRGQSVRVITYTKNATAVVRGRLGENFLTEVSTIHAFCWELIKGFDSDIQEARLANIAEKLQEAINHANSKKGKETDTDRRKYAELDAEAAEIRAVETFIYHPDRNTYGPGALAHSHVIDAAAWLIRNRKTLQKILVDKHPLILIDESQDTMKGILDALFELSEAYPGKIILGLLGDHRQRIYPDGHADLPSRVPKGWERPALQMNHRSQKRIVDLINDIWEADIDGRTQAKDGVRQHSRTEKNGGKVRIFIGDTDRNPLEKIELERQCAAVMSGETGEVAWLPKIRGYKTLALEHKLAAKRGGFLDVYEAMDLLDPDSSSPKPNGERSGPSMVRPLLGAICDLASCIHDDQALDERSAMEVLRGEGVLARLPQRDEERRAAVNKIHDAITAFVAEISVDGATVRGVLAPIMDAEVFDSHRRLVEAYQDKEEPPPEPEKKSQETVENRRKRGWHALFKAPWVEVQRYRAYLNGDAELATHQVVKGSEFKHVMVVMDDGEAGGFLFAYDKVIGGMELSKNDRKNIEEGKETTVDRTLRLLYVTCSRAEETLLLVLWASNPDAAEAAVQKTGWFFKEEISRIK